MKRIATLSTVLAILTLGLAIPAQAATADASAWPSFGEAGTAVEVNISGFSPESTFEVHLASLDGPLLGSGVTSAAGEGSVGVTIPWSAGEGLFNLEVCETTFVACTDTWSDFWVGATATFLVLAPPPTTTGIPEILLEPAMGEAGSTTTVSISGFTPDSTFEVHVGDLCCGLLGSGTSNDVGEAAILVRIPDGVPVGELTISVCETEFVACTDWSSDFWVGATAPFTVVAPPPPATTTTTTEAPTATTEAPTPTAEAPTATTTTVAPTVETTPTPTTMAPVVAADEGVVALPILQESAGDSGSNLWWLVLIFLGAAVIGLLLAWTLQED